MKINSMLLLLLMNVVATVGFAQTAQRVTLRLKNNGVLPREFKFLERHPDDQAPNVFTAYILPGASYTVDLKIGTTLSRVTQTEINASMRGQDVTGKPLLTVKASDKGRIIKLVQ